MSHSIESQLATAVLMIRPARFESNPNTAASNRFQGNNLSSPAEQHGAAIAEFDALVSALSDAGVRTIVVADTVSPHTPDAIFPNNWVSFHADGSVVLYPMEAPNRRAERRRDIVQLLATKYGYCISEVVDLSFHEEKGQYLEGTGSLVLDRVSHVAYACLSSRTHLDALGDFAQRFNYEVVAFDAVDRDGAPIYHTNVLMSVGEKIAVICDEAIPRQSQRQAVLQKLRETGHDVIKLRYAQMVAFAGNMLELRSSNGERVVAMSDQARQSLDQSQLAKIAANGKIVSVPIDSIESSAGGSVRCMLAEIHLQPSCTKENS